jgi:hypothetical protein
MIRARPLDFLDPQLKAYKANDLKKSSLGKLEPLPILFHCGYLTVDKEIQVAEKVPGTKRKTKIDKIVFRLPNFEVASSYTKDCFNAVFEQESNYDIVENKEKLVHALLTKNTDIISDMLSNLFSSITYYQKTKNEKLFHTLVHVILKTMDFKVLSELPGAKSRLNLCFELQNLIYVIIELKYCPIIRKITVSDRTNSLAIAARANLPTTLIDNILSQEVQARLTYQEYLKIQSEIPIENQTPTEISRRLAQEAPKVLDESEELRVLAAAAKKHLPPEIVKNILKKTKPKSKSNSEIAKEQINHALSKAAQKALSDIAERDYHGILKFNAKEIIVLGLAIYGDGSEVKAAFGPS